jgi:hypothetical protein
MNRFNKVTGPQDATDGGDRVAEGRLALVVPCGMAGADGGAGMLRQSMRPDGHQRVESK